jgi:hypothetical protein
MSLNKMETKRIQMSIKRYFQNFVDFGVYLTDVLETARIQRFIKRGFSRRPASDCSIRCNSLTIQNFVDDIEMPITYNIHPAIQRKWCSRTVKNDGIAS